MSLNKDTVIEQETLYGKIGIKEQNLEACTRWDTAIKRMQLRAQSLLMLILHLSSKEPDEKGKL